MATVHANKILTKFMLLLGGHNHCVKVSSDSETVRGMGLWEFSGALRELMLRRNFECFSTLPQLHNGDSDMFLRNRSFLNEPQFVRKRVCKICDFRLPVN